MFHVPNKYRMTLKNMSKRKTHNMAKTLCSTNAEGNQGVFIIPHTNPKNRRTINLSVMCSSDDQWEHCSVLVEGKKRTPTWEEMCFIKDMFWDDHDVVVQYHPAKKDYVNNANFTLHLFRSVTTQFPTPPNIMVGMTDKEVDAGKIQAKSWKNIKSAAVSKGETK